MTKLIALYSTLQNPEIERLYPYPWFEQTFEREHNHKMDLAIDMKSN